MWKSRRNAAVEENTGLVDMIGGGAVVSEATIVNIAGGTYVTE